MLAIAILSLIGFIAAVVYEIFHIEKLDYGNPHMCLSAIMVISWWNICFPLAIVLLCLAAIWAIINIVSIIQERLL
jgi:hypothetical protein